MPLFDRGVPAGPVFGLFPAVQAPGTYLATPTLEKGTVAVVSAFRQCSGRLPHVLYPLPASLLLFGMDSVELVARSLVPGPRLLRRSRPSLYPFPYPILLSRVPSQFTDPRIWKSSFCPSCCGGGSFSSAVISRHQGPRHKFHGVHPEQQQRCGEGIQYVGPEH